VSRIGLIAPPSLRPLSSHQLDTLRLYQQLGTYQAVADFRGVQVTGVGLTLARIRSKLGVATTAAAVAWLEEHPDG
jgi:DNA-binding CsgD family transcriptional regulator